MAESSMALVPADDCSKGIVLSRESQECAKWLPCNYLKQLFRRYPQVDKQVVAEVFQDALIECRDKEEKQVFDFCIIVSDEDIEVARRIKMDLCGQLNLRGVLFEDVAYLGQDILTCYERMMSRSCKILFLITDYFTESAFCTRVQNAVVFKGLMAKAKVLQEKCVPVILGSQYNEDTFPLALSGLAGIKYNDASSNLSFFRKYFVHSKKERSKLEKKIFEQICDSEVKDKILEYYQQQKQEQLAIEEGRRMFAVEDRREQRLAIEAAQKHATSNNAVAIPGGVSAKDLGKIQEALSQISVMNASQQAQNLSCKALESLSNVSLSGENNHVGTKIETNYKIVIKTGKGCDSDTDSDEDDSD